MHKRTAVRVDRVKKVFRTGGAEMVALANVDLAVEPGESVTVMGPSGSGKSTLLHLIGGLDTPTAGEVYVGDIPLSTLRDDDITLLRRRHIGFVFQFFHLLDALSVEENVALPLLLDGVSLRRARARVEAMLQRVGLRGRQRDRPSELSGGEMQRVAIARALVTEPMVLLADEPTGNLDSDTAASVLELLRRLARETGRATILVTHDPSAASYGDRVVSLRDGRVVADEPLRLRSMKSVS